MPDATDTYDLDILRRLGALERRLAALVRIGCVTAVQAAPYRVQCNLGSNDRPVLTAFLPVLVPRAGATSAHSPLSVGEAVLVLAPAGSDTVQYVLPALATARHAPPADEADDATTYHAGDLSIVGDVAVEGDLTVDGDLSVTGSISATGAMSAEGDVSADGSISAGGDVSAGTGTRVHLLTHVHNPPLGGPPQRV